MSDNNGIIGTVVSSHLETDIISAGCFLNKEDAGNFKLRGGSSSNVYINMRNALGSPKVFSRIAVLLASRLTVTGGSASVCGVPHGGVPFAAVAASMAQLPIMGVRRESKSHGISGLVYGGTGDDVLDCVLVDDVISTGTSLLEVVVLLRGLGHKVSRALCVVDRQLGGVAMLQSEGVEVECLTTLARIEAAVGYVRPRGFPNPTNAATARLFQCARRKKSNIILSADVDNMAQLYHLLEQVGDFVCCVKLHADTIADFNAEALWMCARRKGVLLMEDRKLADIGSVMVKQVAPFIPWADFITVHGVSGSDSLLHLGENVAAHGIGLVLIGEMSSKNNLIDPRYSRAVAAFAEAHPDMVGGIVSQSLLTTSDVIHMCPGVKRATGASAGDGAGQGYRTPQNALDAGMHFLIVGRDIYASHDPPSVAEEYQKSCWIDT